MEWREIAPEHFVDTAKAVYDFFSWYSSQWTSQTHETFNHQCQWQPVLSARAYKLLVKHARDSRFCIQIDNCISRLWFMLLRAPFHMKMPIFLSYTVWKKSHFFSTRSVLWHKTCQKCVCGRGLRTLSLGELMTLSGPIIGWGGAESWRKTQIEPPFSWEVIMRQAQALPILQFEYNYVLNQLFLCLIDLYSLFFVVAKSCIFCIKYFFYIWTSFNQLYAGHATFFKSEKWMTP